MWYEEKSHFIWGRHNWFIRKDNNPYYYLCFDTVSLEYSVGEDTFGSSPPVVFGMKATLPTDVMSLTLKFLGRNSQKLCVGDCVTVSNPRFAGGEISRIALDDDIIYFKSCQTRIYNFYLNVEGGNCSVVPKCNTPIQPSIQSESLDSILSTLYDFSTRKKTLTNQELDVYLGKYKGLTGKDKPKFME